MSAEACPSCGHALPVGAVRCQNCKKVFGEANRCTSCQAIAAVREVAEGRYVCAACGTPRPWAAGMVVDAGFADLLAKRAGTSGLMGTLARLSAVGLAVLGVSAGSVQAVFDLGSPALSVTAFMLAAAGLFFLGGRLHAKKAAILEQALERRLVSEASATPGGVTAETAARALSQGTARVDGLLTRMAKQGSLEMEVDDAGTIRYRVAVDDDPSQVESEHSRTLRV
ncbi:MAG: zinc ribbon domain-containing protein [Myxococcales bacterium]|nr:zinc ribbon domain-containing protein [Myxococcales bacterium]MDD9966119.1 zinc ribbon domain-containing protein [Myxococcales bacterium]